VHRRRNSINASRPILRARCVAPPSAQIDASVVKRDGPLSVTPTRNGPLAIRGSLEICSGTGRTVSRVENARLCRCGGSSNKPSSDGTHARIGFQAE
jgi:CDGSH-type Zn-finger protein